MRLNFTTSWIFQGWITCVGLALYAQNTFAKTIQCGPNQYQTRGSKCCDLCGPGLRLYIECSGPNQTKCLRCGSGEYQPGWTQERRCLQQSPCDPGKGFMPRLENPTAEVPCRCRPSLQCSLINCEYCESRPSCRPGHGLEPDPDSPTGRRVCVPCKKGFYSTERDQEPCTQWTSCKGQGRSEARPASAIQDAVCGPQVAGATTAWVIVSVLSAITVLSIFILLLFCYKDKLKLLSVNLRSCVQNLKRTRIQQETLAPLYHSGARALGTVAAETGPGGAPSYIVCETTKLICQAPHSLPSEPLLPGRTQVSGQDLEQEVMSPGRKLGAEEGSERSGEPEEVSDDEGTEGERGKSGEGEEEEKEEVEGGDGPSLPGGSCACAAPVREPLEVGENEDCSQAVCHGTPSSCSCGGGGVGQGRGEEERSEVTSGERLAGGENVEGSGFALPSTTPTPTPTRGPRSSPLLEACTPLTRTRDRLELRPDPSETAQGPETHRLPRADSDALRSGAPSTLLLSPSPLPPVLVSPLPAADLEETRQASSPGWSQGVSWGPGAGNKLLSGGLELDSPPESLHSQLAEPAPTSGQVTGSHNTTFISSGQVMNFSGDVIVVYVSHTSAVGEEGEAAFGSPVQEEAADPQQTRVTPGASITHNPCHASTLPVQEVMADWPRGK